ncbi:MAG: hemerythrin family protein [Candidatus Buchananbacteria bacterium]|nr:hemerythrin family protein [Candidatus Buchananbacteria bacterium]
MAEKLEWKSEYSVNVKEIDEQHKQLFKIFNELVGFLDIGLDQEKIKKIISDIVNFKKEHFATEEKYFHLFNFSGTAEHEQRHRMFDDKIKEISGEYQDDVFGLGFALVDFLGDWLISHLMDMDQKYKECFNEHGLY